jgi:hypothetical protein
MAAQIQDTLNQLHRKIDSAIGIVDDMLRDAREQSAQLAAVAIEPEIAVLNREEAHRCMVALLGEIARLDQLITLTGRWSSASVKYIDEQRECAAIRRRLEAFVSNNNDNNGD